MLRAGVYRWIQAAGAEERQREPSVAHERSIVLIRGGGVTISDGGVKLFVVLLVSCLLYSCTRGPSLGNATNVIIVSRGVDAPQAPDVCPGFNPSRSDVERFLNNATVITPDEEHDFFEFGPCYVRGTAVFRQREATWEMRSAGTGHIIFHDEVVFRIADEGQRVESE